MSTINSVNGVSFGNEEKKKSNGVTPFLATAAGAAVGGLVIKEPISLKKVLSEDTFELSKKAQEGITPEQTAAVTNIQEAQKTNKTIDAEAEKAVDDLFGKEGKDMPVDEFLTKSFGEPLTVEKFKQKVTDVDTQIAKLTNDLAAEDEKVSKADEAGKKVAEEARNQVKTALDAEKAKLEKLKPVKELIDAAQEGKITKGAAKIKNVEIKTNEISKVVSESLETLKGKLPKVKSVKMGLIGAAVGLVAGLILNGIFSPKEKATEV